MALFSPADIADFQALKSDLAYPDTYRLERGQVSATDTRNNRTFTDATVESGPCRLRSVSGNRQNEKIIADKMGWAVAYAVDMPESTIADEKDRLLIDDRTFHIGGIVREAGFGIDATAVCEERSH